MSQHYSDKTHESDPYSLPNVEVFQAVQADCPHCTTTNVGDGFTFYCDSCSKGRKGYTADSDQITKGWYWQACFPGCLPDGDPNGPYETEQAAVDAAQEGDE